MKITALKTIKLEQYPNILWLQILTDEGAIGLGETFYGTEPIISYLHETCAPYLIGKNPLDIEKHNHYLLNSYLGFNSVGVETRAASAVDICLWDLFGKITNQPIYQLLGGASNHNIPVYNTCAGYEYIRSNPTQDTKNFGVPQNMSVLRPFEDLLGFQNDAGRVAESLIDMDIRGMKIWPFDQYAELSKGTYISSQDLKKAISPFEKIRKAVGNKIDIHVEFHSLWQPQVAIQIAKTLEDFDPYWFEDPIKMTSADALADFARRTNVRVTASETLATRWSFKEFFQKNAISVCMFDVGWAGGISEAKKISTMAEAYSLPVAPHDCTGPILLTASVHLAMNAPNALVQEIVRAFYYDWYKELVTELPPINNGYITCPSGPGLGTELQPEISLRKDAKIRISNGNNIIPKVW